MEQCLDPQCIQKCYLNYTILQQTLSLFAQNSMNCFSFDMEPRRWIYDPTSRLCSVQPALHARSVNPVRHLHAESCQLQYSDNFKTFHFSTQKLICAMTTSRIQLQQMVSKMVNEEACLFEGLSDDLKCTKFFRVWCS